MFKVNAHVVGVAKEQSLAWSSRCNISSPIDVDAFDRTDVWRNA